MTYICMMYIQQDHEGENNNRVVHTKLIRESTEEVTSKNYRIIR